MRKFAGNELIEALKQVKEERAEELSLAQKAADWLNGKIDLAVQPVAYGAKEGAPYLSTYLLAVIASFYDHPEKQIKELSQAEEFEKKSLVAIGRDRTCFWVNLGSDEGFPAGTRYYCYLYHNALNG